MLFWRRWKLSLFIIISFVAKFPKNVSAIVSISVMTSILLKLHQLSTIPEQSRFLKQKMLENDKMRVKQLRRFDVETTQKNRQGELINISSTLKVESTSKFPRRIDVIISTCIRLLKSIKSQRTFHVEFRWRINKDVSIGITPIFYVFN